MGRIKCGGGDDGEPVQSPPGWKSYASRCAAVAWRKRCGHAGLDWPRDWAGMPKCGAELKRRMDPMVSRHWYAPRANPLGQRLGVAPQDCEPRLLSRGA